MPAWEGALILGLLCAAWGLVQRFTARVDKDLDKPHCGCHGREIRDLDRRDA